MCWVKSRVCTMELTFRYSRCTLMILFTVVGVKECLVCVCVFGVCGVHRTQHFFKKAVERIS